MFSFANAPQSIGEVLADGFKLYKLTVLKMLPVAALALLIGAIPALSGVSKVAAPDRASLIILGITLGLTLFATLLVLAVLVRGMYALGLGREQPWADSAQVVMGKFFSIATAFLVSSVCIVSGFMMFFFPGVFFGIMFLFSMPLVVLDDLGGLAAIKKSWHLVWGHWWTTFLAMLSPMLISIFLMALVLGIAQQNQLLLTVLNVVVMSFSTPFFYAVLLVQFNNLKLQQAAKLAKKPKQNT